MREKLTELVLRMDITDNVGNIVDFLIANGVTIPVRCKDCIHRFYLDMGDEIGVVGGCELFGIAMHYDCFCSYGERRADGES